MIVANGFMNGIVNVTEASWKEAKTKGHVSHNKTTIKVCIRLAKGTAEI